MLLSVSNPSEAVGSPETLFYYDEADRLSMLESDYFMYFMTYDGFNRLLSAETSSCDCFIINDYDDDGNVSAQYYGYYDWGDFTYDDDGRLLSESYNAELAYEYSYADNGQLSRVADHENDVVWNYGYDLAGRLRNVYSDDDRSFNYSYNEKNQVGGFKFLQGGSTQVESCYTYDSAGRAVGMSTPTMTGEPTQEYSYDTLGRTSSVTNEYAENGEITQSFTYKVNGTNQTGRVNGITYRNGSEMILPALGYGYDANGNITEIYKNGILWIQYYYDELNRLVREDNGDIGKSIVYAYGKTGNILSKTEYSLSFDELGTPVDTIAYAYGFGASPHAVKNYDGEAIHYNERGNPIDYRDFTMTWARGQQLATVAGEELYMTFKYDSNGLRTLKTVNGVATEFTYIGDMLVSQKTGNEIINFAYTAGGAPYGFTYNGASYYYLLNLQGDVIAIYDSTGTVVVEYLYDSWGKLESITGSLASTIGIKNPLRYRGYYYDIETRLYYLQSRYYDPETGRFISMDAYFVAGDYLQGINMYSYCLNNPIMYVDPTGYAANFINSFFVWLVRSLFNIGTGNINAIIAYNQASDAIGFTIYDAEYQKIDVKEKSSGIKEVTMIIEGYATPDSKQRETFYIAFCYGTGDQWLDEYKYYYYDSKHEIKNIVIRNFWDVAVFAIGKIPKYGNIIGDTIEIIQGIASRFPDHYESALNQVYGIARNDLTGTHSVMVSIWTKSRNVYFSSMGMI